MFDNKLLARRLKNPVTVLSMNSVTKSEHTGNPWHINSAIFRSP